MHNIETTPMAMMLACGNEAWRRNMQAIYAEMTDYARRFYARQADTFEACLQAHSMEDAFDIQVGYLRQSWDDYCEHLGRVTQLSNALLASDRA